MKKYLFVSAILLSGILYSQSTGVWIPVSDMSTKRNGQTVTQLADDNILVTGGYDGIGNLKTAEVYNTTTDTWYNVGDMDSIRFQHTSTLLDNGKVLITGGWDGGFINYRSTLIYDPATETFTSGPIMRVGRSGHTATKLNDGRVLIAGGYDLPTGNTDSVEIYDPVSNTISIGASMRKGRSYHTATLLSDGRVLVAGGYNPDYAFQMKSCEIYNPATDSWTDAASMYFGREYSAACLIDDYGTVMVSGGLFFNGVSYEGLKSAEIYYPLFDQWKIIPDMPEGQSYHKMFYYNTAATACTRNIIIPGGTDNSGIGTDLTFSKTYSFNLCDSTWNADFMFNDGRYYYGASAKDGYILVCGGLDQTVEIFSYQTQAIQSIDISDKIKIFPNPASENITVTYPQSQLAHIEILNIMGQKITAAPVLQDNKNYFYLPVTNLPPGYYILNMEFENNKTAKAQFIKN